MRVAIQMDPIEGININEDSTFLLALEAQERGYELFYYNPRHLFLENGSAYAHLFPLTVHNKSGAHFALGTPKRRLLSDMDVIWIRQDPPFNMSYISTTYILEKVRGKTLLLNNPSEIRNAPEKLFVCNFPALMPPTLISSEFEEIQHFQKVHGDIVIKPLYGCGGTDVFRIREGSDNFRSIVEELTERYNGEPVVAQRFIPEVKEGDKRIILIEGKPAGAVLRVPAQNEFRANFHAGGTGVKTAITPRDEEICSTIGVALKEKGLLFVGIDVIGGYLTEINVTSPTGLHQINRLNGVKLEKDIWDAVEARIS